MLTWVEVDLGAIKKNIKQIRKYIGPNIGVAAVIKSNAYGHGIEEVAKAAFKAGAEFLCVDNVQEAKQICGSTKSYKLKANVLILGGVESEDLPWVIKNSIRFGIYDLAFAEKIEEVAKKIKRKALAHIKIDTGMHRLGFDSTEAIISIVKINKNYKNIAIEGLWSHFADSGSRENKKYTNEQIKKFINIIDGLEKEGFKIKYKHLCNSSGTIALPEAHFDLVRSGIIIYGIFPSKIMKKNYQKRLNLKPAMSFKTRIVSLRNLNKGERIGYGLTYRLKKNSKIAVLSVGYKDGYGRNLSNKGEVVIKNKRCPVVGRICMRMMMVDVSSVPGVKLDEEVVLLGGEGRAKIEADEVAEKMDTIPYEVVARIAESVPRVYKN
ncbi:MAG: alanine racemase [Candidatus Berkelbacteria bacterium]|nr:alanine racemase [Candidatus Berkelbacteria bacterium]